MKIEKVTVIGMGYVGLTLAAVLAERGFTVTGIDIDENLLKKLNMAEPHFYEKGLALLIGKSIGKKLFFQKNIPDEQDVFILSVGTPIDNCKKPDMAFVKSSAEQIFSYIKDNNLVILRSTVPIGATRNVVKPILDKSNKKYFLAFCPERTIEGRAIPELKELPQIIGGIDEESVDMAFELFKKVTNTIIKMSSLEASEMVKLLCNSYRDLVFAYANETALICEKIGLDPIEVIRAANIGYERSKIPNPGFVGGLCLEKDPHILADCISKTEYKPKLITQGREVNEYIIDYVIEKITKNIGKSDKIFLSGLAFKGKPDTDDIRASPAIKIIEKLLMKGYDKIKVHDFIVSGDNLKSKMLDFVSLEDGFKEADAVLICNDNEKYNYIEIDKYLKLMKKNSIFFDIWRLFDSSLVSSNGIKYLSIGK